MTTKERREKIPLTLDLLNAALTYEPSTGHLRRKFKAKKNRGQVGDIVGHTPCSISGYRNVRLYGIRYRAHRLAWGLTHQLWPIPHEIDHVNGDRADNHLSNLRAATHAENLRNRRGPDRDNKAGAKGVTLLPNGRYVARAGSVYLGCHATADDARRAYNAYAKNIFGAFFTPA